jgi:outer membrane protein assembly factor BamB
MKRGLFKIICLLPFLAFVVQCGRGRDLEIKRVVFGREAVAVELTAKAPVANIKLSGENGESLAEIKPGPDDFFLLPFSWEPGKDYRVEVARPDGAPPLSVACHSPWKPSPIILASFRMESDVEPRGIQQSAYLGGRAAVSADGRYAAVGTEKSYLRLFDVVRRREAWSRRIGEGRIMEIGFSPDGSRLLVGEMSRDAFLYCFDSATGKELWRHRTADEIGEMEAGDPRTLWPIVTGLAIVRDGSSQKCYVTAKRQCLEGKSNYYKSKIYCFDISSGAISWMYPKEGVSDVSPSMLATDARGRYVLVNNWKKGKISDKALYCLSGESGDPLWEWSFKQLYPGRDYFIWHGFGISSDGSLVTVFSQDGRGFLLDHGKLLESGGRAESVIWEREISTPIDVNGMSLVAQGSVAQIDENCILLATGSTIVQQGTKAKVLIEHPSGNSLFAYGLDGRLLWTFKPGGLCYDVLLAGGGRYVIAGAAHGRTEKDGSGHGVYVFDNAHGGSSSDRLAWFYHMDGICISADSSSDGLVVAALEYPVDMDPRDEFEDVHGAHVFHLLR